MALLDNGIKQELFRKDIDKELQLYLLGKQLHFLKDPEITSKLEYPISVIISTIFINFIYAISTEKGLKEFERLRNTAKRPEDGWLIFFGTSFVTREKTLEKFPGKNK